MQSLLQTTPTQQLTSAIHTRSIAAVLTALALVDAVLGTQFVDLFTHSRPGIQLVTGVIILGVIGIVVVIVYIVVASFGNNIPVGTLSAGQQSTLTTLINASGNSLSLVSVLEIVVAAGLIIGGIFAFLSFAR
jgi:hypothetical protein